MGSLTDTRPSVNGSATIQHISFCLYANNHRLRVTQIHCINTQKQKLDVCRVWIKLHLFFWLMETFDWSIFLRDSKPHKSIKKYIWLFWKNKKLKCKAPLSFEGNLYIGICPLNLISEHKQSTERFKNKQKSKYQFAIVTEWFSHFSYWQRFSKLSLGFRFNEPFVKVSPWQSPQNIFSTIG